MAKPASTSRTRTANGDRSPPTWSCCARPSPGRIAPAIWAPSWIFPATASGFSEEQHGRLDSMQSKIKGIYIAGACQAPMDIQRAISQGLASASCILSGAGRRPETGDRAHYGFRAGGKMFALPDLRAGLPLQGHQLSGRTGRCPCECAAVPRLRDLRGRMPGGRHPGESLYQPTDPGRSSRRFYNETTFG